MHAVRLALLATVIAAAPPAQAQRTAGPEPAPCTSTRRPAYAPWVFLGYACSGACEEHKAGFAAAEQQGIADPAACIAAKVHRAEGCRAYAETAVTAELAGFEWARENEITESCACTGAGDAFEAGCRAYVETRGE